MLRFFFFICLFFFCDITLYAQDSSVRHMINVRTNESICVRVEGGWNKSWFQSAGLSYLFQTYSEHSSAYYVPYVAAEVNYANYASKDPFFMAYKAGLEVGGSLMAIAGEARLYSGNKGEQLVFTPKIGFSLLGTANLFYGYNIFRNSANIYGIGHSQISLNINFTVFKIRESVKKVNY